MQMQQHAAGSLFGEMSRSLKKVGKSIYQSSISLHQT